MFLRAHVRTSVLSQRTARTTVYTDPTRREPRESARPTRPRRYRGGVFRFSFAVPGTYPHEPPKVKCLAKVYHPNLDHDGNVCLNILREDWKPVLFVSSCVYGLTFLFSDPNPDDPLNKEAAKEMTESPRQFEQNVRRSMQGGYVGGTTFSNVTR